MYTRLAFAVATAVDPDILITDEVLAVGDEAFQRKCMDRILRFRHYLTTLVSLSILSSTKSYVEGRKMPSALLC
jgi:lipopolysaccharide transport system ATP-binding protein